MSGTSPAPQTGTTPDADTGTTEQDDPTTTDPKDGEENAETDVQTLAADRDKWKAMSRKNQTNAEKNAADAKAWRDYQDSKKTDDERRAEADKQSQEQRDSVIRENALLKLGIKHGLDQDGLDEIAELLDGLPADQFGERAEKLAARLASTKQENTTPPVQPDKRLGQETPPGGTSTGDFLRDAMKRR